MIERPLHPPMETAPLKVVHLCATDTGGAGRAAYRLHKALQGAGVDSLMLVLSRKNDDPSVRIIPAGARAAVAPCPESFPPNEEYAQRVWQHWSRALSEYPRRKEHIECFSDDYSELSLESVQEIRDADIVNLHWVAGMFNAPNARLALAGKQVVWTMHDMNPFTGGCHYAGRCTRYREGCGSCPVLGSSSDSDWSRATHTAKRSAYAALELHPVSPSRWLARCADASSALCATPTRVIPNGLPTELYRPSGRRQEIRDGFGIPAGAKVVLFGADIVLNERKGFGYLFEALKRITRRDIVFAFFGKMPRELQLELNLPLLNLGFVSEEETLAELYSMADLFIIPSVEDNLPNTVIEAMACGVPVLGFEIGGIPDMVTHKETGYLVPAGDIAGLVQGMEWCLFAPEGAALGKRCRDEAVARYSLEVHAQGYLRFYREVLAGKEERDGRTRSAPPDASATGMTHAPQIMTRTPLPKISLVTPSYNYAQYLEGCLDSVLSQNYANLEYIVMDGGSTDGTVNILKRYERHLSHWQSRPDGGQYRAIDDGFRRSTGEIMTWLNADDMFHPGAFDTAAAIFAGDRGVEWIMGRPNSFEESGAQKGVLPYLPLNSRARYLADEEFIQQEGIFWRRTLWERAGSHIRTDMKLAADLELWARFFRHAPLFAVDTLLAGFRDHPLQKSKDKAGYTAEANVVLARERELFARERRPYSPPAPLPILVQKEG